jgi:hypothetical protein
MSYDAEIPADIHVCASNHAVNLLNIFIPLRLSVRCVSA